MGSCESCEGTNTDIESKFISPSKKKQNITAQHEQKVVVDEDKDDTGIDEEDLTFVSTDHVNEDYSWKCNKPDKQYARKLTTQEQIAFMPIDIVEKKRKHLGVLKISSEFFDKAQRYSHTKWPFRIDSLNCIYIGQWRKGLPNGIGKFYYDDGSVYEGISLDGNPHIYGRHIRNDASHYQGSFYLGKFEGQGVLSKFDGFVYRGEFIQDLPDGTGTEKWPNGTTYVGKYLKGKKNGFGIFTWKGKEIEIYEGEFKNDLFHGKGQYRWNDGRTYDGEWKQGRMDGIGNFKWKDGRRYEGQYKEDLKDGFGTFYWEDGKSWSGYWKFGKMDGIGTLNVEGNLYKGQWKKGKRVRWLKDQNNEDSLFFLDESFISAISLNTSFNISYGEQKKQNNLSCNTQTQLENESFSLIK